VIGPDERIIPSLMFHSVGMEQSRWMWRHLSEPVDVFESKLEMLCRRNCRTVFWPEVHAHVSGRRRLPPKTVMLTFDDGYLDNWVYVWPLLKKYSMRATIFVSADFIEPDGPARPTLEDVWRHSLPRESLQAAGFLRPSEMRAMVDSGLVDIQSHASTHTWYFNGDVLTDVYGPEKYAEYPWMAWNARPERKPFYLIEDQSQFVPTGEPIFAHAKALVARRFIPQADAVEAFRREWLAERTVSSAHGRTEPDSIRRVLERIGIPDHWPGIHESDSERGERIAREIAGSRKRLETVTGREVRYICWPGGGYDEVAMSAARYSGFLAYTLGSNEGPAARNLPGGRPEALKRIGTHNHLRVRGRDCGHRGARYQWLCMRAHQNSLVHRLALFGYKSWALTAATLRGAAR
jgi:peptidoglycan/xylan/chitin deacetylase (PgdA/CDA1 family)